MRLNPVWNWVHLVLGLAALLHAEANKASCDHERARQSREVIQQNHDLAWRRYDIQHTARHRHHGIQWRCGFCDKVFRTEAFLDQHMDNNHHNETHLDGNVCLADWCEVLHCDHFAGRPGTRNFFHHHTAACRAKAKNKLQQQCQELAQSCFPPSVSRESALMYDYFTDHFCGAHTCSQKERQARLKTVDQLGSQHRAWGYRILVGLLMLCMALLYAGIWVYLQYYSGQGQPDIRSNRRFSLWSQVARKTKVY